MTQCKIIKIFHIGGNDVKLCLDYYAGLDGVTGIECDFTGREGVITIHSEKEEKKIYLPKNKFMVEIITNEIPI